MVKGAWCDHMFLNDAKTEWAYGKCICRSCESWIILQAQDDWKWCPVCGAKRPKEKE